MLVPSFTGASDYKGTYGDCRASVFLRFGSIWVDFFGNITPTLQIRILGLKPINHVRRLYHIFGGYWGGGPHTICGGRISKPPVSTQLKRRSFCVNGPRCCKIGLPQILRDLDDFAETGDFTSTAARRVSWWWCVRFSKCLRWSVIAVLCDQRALEVFGTVCATLHK